MQVGHECGPSCLAKESRIISEQPSSFVVLKDGVLSKSNSLFAVPLMFGWSRDEYSYTTPCGQKKYKMSHIKKYLRKTASRLSIEQFNLDYNFNCWSEIRPSPVKVINEDISRGQENLAIPVVNDVDDQVVDLSFEYFSTRIALPGVDMNIGLVSGCNCKTDCSDALTCDCRRLTDEAAEGAPDISDFEGYRNKLLPSVYVHGIYECNPSCSCLSRCLNRVTQEGIKAQLEVFRTKNKGWGLRSLHDLPQGFFICLYSGEVMKDDDANELGPIRGNEYFVKLGLIEIVEQKIGFESDVDDDSLLDASEELDNNCTSSTDSSIDSLNNTGKRTSQSQVRDTKKIKLDQKEQNDEPESKDFVRVREHLVRDRLKIPANEEVDADEEAYVIDGKTKGNVGRFLNHSCHPNCFLQNVFSETHDPRFPVLAFFTLRPVKALEELTWNYMYDDGDDVFDCDCGSDNCKHKESLSVTEASQQSSHAYDA